MAERSPDGFVFYVNHNGVNEHSLNGLRRSLHEREIVYGETKPGGIITGSGSLKKDSAVDNERK